MTLGWYDWHPYEAQALICGLFAGVIFGVQLHRMWSAWRLHRGDLARAHGAGFAATLAWLRSLPRSEAEAVLWPNDPRPVGEDT